MKPIDADALLEKLQRMIDYCKNDNQVNGLTALFQVGDAIMDCHTLTPPNEPLTWSELAEMVNQPVYIVEMGAWRYWALVTHVGKDSADFVSVHDPDDYGDKKLYGKSWVAYRRPPEGEGKPTEPPNV